MINEELVIVNAYYNDSEKEIKYSKDELIISYDNSTIGVKRNINWTWTLSVNGCPFKCGSVYIEEKSVFDIFDERCDNQEMKNIIREFREKIKSRRL
jgi:hypothetical protein